MGKTLNDVPFCFCLIFCGLFVNRPYDSFIYSVYNNQVYLF